MALTLKRELLKLNLGCGADLRTGFTNVDKFPVNSSVQQANFPLLPFAENSSTEIVLSHVLEHFGYADAVTLCKEMHRVLCIGGFAYIEVPDIEWCIEQFLKAPEPLEYTDPCFDYNTQHRWGLFAQSIWGDQHNDGLYHKWGYTEPRLLHLLQQVGFATVRVEKIFSHGVQCLAVTAFR